MYTVQSRYYKALSYHYIPTMYMPFITSRKHRHMQDMDDVTWSTYLSA